MIVASERSTPAPARIALPPDGAADEGIPAEPPHRLALPWIVRLRAGMIAGEILVIAAVAFALEARLPYALLGVPILLQAGANLLLSRRGGRVQRSLEHIVGGLFCLDALCLTVILAATGGPNNPFSLLYLVQITFSAVILHRAWTWALGILSTLCFGLLFWISRDIPALEAHTPAGEFSVHLLGMWLAFTAAALLISFFIAKVSAEARRKERELLRMQRRLARNERLASLVTLSAGAAHEIATPLSTIAITAREMAHDAGRLGDRRMQEDAMLIRSQVERCRHILERMGAQGADPLGEAPRQVRCADLFSAVRRRFPAEGERIRIQPDGNDALSCRVPERAAVEALAALARNALDASPPDAPVILAAARSAGSIRLSVRDHGTGMTPEVLERVIEPFYTTKPAGRGMGLGAFLVHLFAQRLGGSLAYESTPGHGATAVLDLPDADVPE